MGEADFENICRKGWRVGAANGLLNDLRQWDEAHGREEHGGQTWTTYSPAIDDKRKQQFRALVRAILAEAESIKTRVSSTT